GTEFRGFTVRGGGVTHTLRVDGSASPTIWYNLFCDNIPVGSENVEVISCLDASAHVTRNIFSGNGGIGCVGLRVGAQGSWIVNNTFDNNERGFFSIASGGFALNNIVTNSIELGVVVHETSNFTLLDYNDIWNNPTDYSMPEIEGPNDIHVDPLYLDAISRNYSLSDLSPCINAGHPDSEYDDPDSSRNDIGAVPLHAWSDQYPLAAKLNFGADAHGDVLSSPTPAIYWTFTDTSGVGQVQYEIEVDSDGSWSSADLWSTDAVTSPDTQAVYAGLPLADHSDLYVRVRVSNGSAWGTWSMRRMSTNFNPTILVPEEYLTIQEAIDTAFNGDTILVGPGDYTENIDFLGKQIVILSTAGPEVTVLRPANPAASTIKIASEEPIGTEINGFSITGGGDTHTIAVSGSAGVLIRNNVIHDNIPIGSGNVEVVSCNNASVVVTRNVFYNNGGIGCVGLRSGAENSWIINNTFDGNERGFFSIAGGGYAINNIVTNSIDGGVNAGSSGDFTLLDYNDVWNNNPDYMPVLSPGPNDIQVDPEYLELVAHDYRLLPGSPCINAGHPDSLYNDPDSTRSDMGALWLSDVFPYVGMLELESEDPWHVVNHSPKFRWLFVDTLPSQIAYEIEVGVDQDWSTAEMWSPGQVYTADTFAVYSGLPLEDGTLYYFRVRLYNGIQWGGWRTRTLYMNSAPTEPMPFSPVGGETVHVSIVSLSVDHGSDAENDPLLYDFELYEDPGLILLVESVEGVDEDSLMTSTGFLQDLSPEQSYWWRARSFDGFETSDWSDTEWFVTRSHYVVIHVPGQRPTIQTAVESGFHGDTILVAPGTYQENIDFLGRQLILTSSEGAQTTTLTPMDPELPTVSIEDVPMSGTELAGFTITGGGQEFTVAIKNAVSATLSACVFRDNIPVGTANREVIRCQETAVLVTRCLFYDNGGIGCVGLRGGAHDSWIINNTFDGNESGFFSIAGGGYAINNIVTNSLERGVGALSASDFTLLDYNNTWNNNPNYDVPETEGANDIHVDPLYTNPLQGDYSLLNSSPCIDAGHPDSQYDDSDGSRGDIGAIPFVIHCVGIRGNVDYDPGDVIDISDLVYLVDFMFSGGPEPVCFDEADIDGSGVEPIDIADLVYLVDYMFTGGPPPAACP
ncbi:MAG: hypothetical protein OEV80_15525, partial [candidate division Zixibacteria bacterium]|nr:hypothetical protein [candidate division Zixibacteria bacterium]